MDAMAIYLYKLTLFYSNDFSLLYLFTIRFHLLINCMLAYFHYFLFPFAGLYPFIFHQFSFLLLHSLQYDSPFTLKLASTPHSLQDALHLFIWSASGISFVKFLSLFLPNKTNNFSSACFEIVFICSWSKKRLSIIMTF